MRNAFLLITNTPKHAEEEWNTKVPPRGHQISKDTTLSTREAEGYPLRHWQPKVETSKSREGARVHQQRTQEHLRSSETTGEHRRPVGHKTSEYNLFLKDKMSAGMSMVDAVKAWKEKEGGSSSASSSMRQPGQDWQSPSQQY